MGVLYLPRSKDIAKFWLMRQKHTDAKWKKSSNRDLIYIV